MEAAMIVRRRYEEERSESAQDALDRIRARLERGWQLLLVGGAAARPWQLTYQRDLPRPERDHAERPDDRHAGSRPASRCPTAAWVTSPALYRYQRFHSFLAATYRPTPKPM